MYQVDQGGGCALLQLRRAYITRRVFAAETLNLLASKRKEGLEGSGTITAIFSVLVAGSDMEEPIADILRGVLDGHVVLDRKIAERGRYPAIDVLRSVSRSLPHAATEAQNDTIGNARRMLGAYAQNEMMIRAGLYSKGSDPTLDAAIAGWPDLDAFLSEKEGQSIENSFNRLALILRRANSGSSRQTAAGTRSTEPSPRRESKPVKAALPSPMAQMNGLAGGANDIGGSTS